MKHTTAMIALLMLAPVLPSHGHEGEEHDAPQAPSVARPQSWFTLNTMSQEFEVVLRYFPAKAKEEMHMKLFLSDFETNAPIANATFAVTCLEDKSVQVEVHYLEPGIYELHATFPENKLYTLAANISDEARADLLQLGPIEVGKEWPHDEEGTEPGIGVPAVILVLGGVIIGVGLMWLIGRRKRMAASVLIVLLILPGNLVPPLLAHEGHDHGEPSREKQPSTLRTDEVEVLKETQFLFDMRTAFALRSNTRTVIALYGQVTPSADGEAAILAPQNGAIAALHVRVGERVKKGQVLATVQQNLSASEQVQLQNEKNNTLREYESALREYERLNELADVVAGKELIEAKLRLDRAIANKAIYDNLGSQMFTLTAPISGAVDNFNLSIGQQVLQGDLLFRLLDTEHLKVVARIYDNDLHKLQHPESETAESSLRFSVECIQEDEHFSEDAKLIAYGQAVNPANQSSEVVLALENKAGNFKPGQFVNVYVKAEGAAKEIAVPSSAVSDINGKPVVFVHTLPEVLETRWVRTGDRDTNETVILWGLEERDRAIISGTYQAKSIFLNR